MSKILTVSVAAYNVESYIRETLDSFLVAEVMDEIEVLIINDGSTDKTEQLCREYTERYPGTFYLVNKKNGGWGSTVNKGIELASGKYFKQLDGDDYFDKNTLENYVHFLKEHDEDIVYTNYRRFDDETGNIVKEDVIENSELLNKRMMVADINIGFMLAMHACTFKTEKLKQSPIDITEHCFYTDIEYLVKSVLRMETIYFLPVNVYCYRVGREGQSASITGFRKHYREHVTVTLKLLDLYGNLSESTQTKSMIFERINNMVDYQYYIFLNLEPTKQHAEEMKEFDNIIKNKYPFFYPNNRSRVKAFRSLGRIAYPFLVYRHSI